MLKRFLLAPGPTPVPHEALLAMAAPVMHHRTPQFSEIFRSVIEGSRRLFGTEQAVMPIAASGSGGMEAAVTNTLSPGERVIVVCGGKFGERWAEIGRAYGLEVTGIEVEWGRPVDPAEVAAALDAHPETRAILVQYCETSTTVVHPVEKLAELTRGRDCLLIVDGITAVGVMPVPMDELGIDVLLTASQKALMLPPGLCLIALSEKAWAANARSTLPRYYFDLARERKSVADNTSAYTPAISLIVGLARIYELIEAGGGWKQAYRRQALLGEATRRGVLAMGLRLLAPEAPSPAATGVWVPEGVDGGSLTKHLRDVMGVTVAGGQARLKGKILRLAHIGYQDGFDVIVGLAAVEMALKELGGDVKLGSGVAAAQAVLSDMYRKAE